MKRDRIIAPQTRQLPEQRTVVRAIQRHVKQYGYKRPEYDFLIHTTRLRDARDRAIVLCARGVLIAVDKYYIIDRWLQYTVQELEQFLRASRRYQQERQLYESICAGQAVGVVEGRLTSQTLLTLAGIRSATTLTRWHNRGLIPKPTIDLHPNGKGRIAYWPPHVLTRCVRIRTLTEAGVRLKEIAKILEKDPDERPLTNHER